MTQILFNSFSSRKIENLNFWDSRISLNFKKKTYGIFFQKFGSEGTVDCYRFREIAL